MSDHYFEVAQKLEAQLAEARRRIAELEAAESAAIIRAGELIGRKLESQCLAAATALLERCRDEWVPSVDEYDDPVTQELARDLDAYLAAQTDAPPEVP